MKKSIFTLAAIVVLSVSTLPASAAMGGGIPRPQAMGGGIPRPQISDYLNGAYAATVALFGL